MDERSPAADGPLHSLQFWAEIRSECRQMDPYTFSSTRQKFPSFAENAGSAILRDRPPPGGRRLVAVYAEPKTWATGAIMERFRLRRSTGYPVRPGTEKRSPAAFPPEKRLGGRTASMPSDMITIIASVSCNPPACDFLP